MSKLIFDYDLLRLRRNKSELVQYNKILSYASNNILEQLNLRNITPSNILEIGARNGILTEKLKRSYPNAHITASDISSKLLEQNQFSDSFVICNDEEFIDHIKIKQDVVISILNFHWINDIRRLFANIKSILNNGAIIISSLYGNRSLHNLRKTLIDAEVQTGNKHFAHIIPFIKDSDLAALMQNLKFSNITVSNETIELEFKDCLELMYFLKSIGENNHLLCLQTKFIYRINKLMLEYLKSKVSKPFIDKLEIITIIANKEMIPNLKPKST